MNYVFKNARVSIHSLLAVLSISAFISFSAVLSAGQETRELTAVKPKVSDKRTALVIGNGKYLSARKLANPVNDAIDMSAALKELGFEVIFGSDLTLTQMRDKVLQFKDRLIVNGGVGLFYYAGHGVRINGKNLLLPVDLVAQNEGRVEADSFLLGDLLVQMKASGSQLNILIFDACRVNPFQPKQNFIQFHRSVGSKRPWYASIGEGLATVGASHGTLVLYAAEPGKTASDGKERNGLFTASLLKQMNQPNLGWDDLVRAVSAEVWEKSNGSQFPWKEGNSLDNFYFVPPKTADLIKKTNSPL